MGTKKKQWLSNFQKYYPQLYSQAAALLIFISGGMSLAWGLGFSAPYRGLDIITSIHIQICWFIGVIIGAVLGTAFINILPRKILNLFGPSFVILNGILLTAGHRNEIIVIFARYFDGIAVGITVIIAIMTGSGQAAKQFRGVVLSSEALGLAIGIMIKTISVSNWNSDLSVCPNQLQGILVLILGALALLAEFFLTIETPVLAESPTTEHHRMAVLKSLQTFDHDEISSLYFETTKYIEEDRSRGWPENLRRSYVPMVKLCFYRAFVGISFSLPLNWGLFVASTVISGGKVWWSPNIYGTMRVVGVIITIFTLDTLGRSKLTAFALLAGGSMLVSVGAVFANTDNLDLESKMNAMIALLTVYQFLAGISSPACNVYLGEAFSISVKPLCILVAVVFENIIQIIICCCFSYTAKGVSDYSLALGTLQLVFAVIFLFIMPETKKKTFANALELFCKPLFIFRMRTEDVPRSRSQSETIRSVYS